MDVTPVINTQFVCARCHASGSWVLVGRPQSRQNSSIYRLQCTRCQEQIVAKVSRRGDLGDAARVQARHEYETLCELQRVFPQDEHYGTLVSLGYVESSERGIMITRHFRGSDLTHYLRSPSAPGAPGACHAAGVWLRKLHDSNQVDQQTQVPGVADKLEYLKDTYGAVLRPDRNLLTACRRLEQAASHTDSRRSRVVRQHGDFKPQNMLCDGIRYIGLDIQWQSIGSAIYDLAPFLNHLWLAGRTLGCSFANRHYRHRESMFLAGYGYRDEDDTRAVHWAQLYFALCYVGGYRQKGRLAAGYASWRLGPLIRELSARLADNS